MGVEKPWTWLRAMRATEALLVSKTWFVSSFLSAFASLICEQVHLTMQPDQFESTKELVLQSIRKDGFEWNDVQDVFPAQGFVSELSREGVLDSAKFQNAYTTKTADYKVRD
jgi:hypothetical protein